MDRDAYRPTPGPRIPADAIADLEPAPAAGVSTFNTSALAEQLLLEVLGYDGYLVQTLRAGLLARGAIRAEVSMLAVYEAVAELERAGWVRCREDGFGGIRVELTSSGRLHVGGLL